jgi:hypothetical protein
MDEDQIAVKGDIWLVQSLTCFVACSDSFLSALRQAYAISARTASWAEAPNAIVKVGSDQRIGAEEIVAWWRHLGWSLPAQSG